MTAYLGALNAHDCDTAQAVVTADAKDSAKLWCENVASLTDTDVRDHFTERPKDSQHAAPDEVADVPVTFDLNWRLFHNDGTIEEGGTSLGLPPGTYLTQFTVAHLRSGRRLTPRPDLAAIMPKSECQPQARARSAGQFCVRRDQEKGPKVVPVVGWWPPGVTTSLRYSSGTVLPWTTMRWKLGTAYDGWLAQAS